MKKQDIVASNSNASPDKANAFDLIAFTADVTAAYFSNHDVPQENIPQLVNTIYQSLSRLVAHGCASMDRPEPAVPVKKSISDDYIVCLEDGKKLKMLKRHLKTAYNMTPEQYRERWGLTADYPMVAPNYAKRRSNLAMEIGLGRKRKVQKEAA